MQPVIPLWVTVALAFAAPVFALAGVVIGAVMNRNTTRLQLEAGRKRDRELWAREDRHRFTEQKRVLYAELLTSLSRHTALVDDVIGEIAVKFAGQAENLKDNVLEAYKFFFSESDLASSIQASLQESDDRLAAIDLVAPESIRKTAWQAYGNLRASTMSAIGTWQQPDALDHLHEARRKQLELREQIRADLATSPE